MKKTMIKFLMWFLVSVIALPAMLLITPAQAQAATKSTVVQAPVTQLTTTPKNPNENGWFNKVTLIKLKPMEEGRTYFQWNSIGGVWTEYAQPFRAWRGENTLYYYSTDSEGVKEAIKSQIIKVDYTRPESSTIIASGSRSEVRLSWENNPNIVSYRIAKNYKELAKVESIPPFFIDKDVEVGETYNYKLKAISQAGLKSKAIKTSVKVSSEPAETIKPMISEQAATIVAAPSQKVGSLLDGKGGVVAIGNDVKPPIVDNPSSPAKNWNRLFIALSILIIAAGAAIAGYYGYEWWMSKRDNEGEPRDKKTNNRW